MLEAKPRRQLTFTVFALVLLSGSTTTEAAKPTEIPRPDLVQLLQEFSPTEEHLKAGAVVLWNDRITEIDDQGMQVDKEHLAVLVLDDQAASDYGEVTFGFNSFYSEVRLDQARVVFPDGTVKSISKDAVQVKTSPDRKFYTDVRWLTCALPSLIPGAAVEFRFSRKQVKPVIEGFWARVFAFHHVHWREAGENPRIDPVDNARLTVRYPGEAEIVTAVRNTDATPRIDRKAGVSTYVWEKSDLPAVPVQWFSPPLWDEVASVALGSTGDWTRIDTWAAGLMLPQASPSRALKRIVKDHARGETTDREKVEALFDFVQNEIRYIHADVLRGGLTPHEPEEVLSNGYGDCKDQSVLLVALVRAAGIEAYPALVGTFSKGDLVREVPRPGSFNHAIVYVPLADGDLWIDSSPSSARVGELYWGVQDRWAFVVNGEGGKLLRTPTTRPEESRGELSIIFEFVNDRLEATVIVTASGPLGSQFKSALVDNPQRDEYVERMIRRIYSMARVKSTSFPELDVGGRVFRSESRIELADAWKPGQNVARYSGNIAPLLMLFTNLAMLPDPNERETDYVTGLPVELTLEILCPTPFEEYRLRTPLASETGKSEAFSFRKQLQWEGDAINARVEFSLERSRIALVDYEEFYEAMRGALVDSRWNVNFEPRERVARPAGALSADVALVEREYPGVHIALPEWKTEMEVLEAIDGGVALRPPVGAGEIRLAWEAALPMELWEIKQIMIDTLAVDVEEEGETTVDGRDGYWILAKLPSHYLVLTGWTCSDEYQVNLLTLLDMPREDLLELQERMVGTARCVEVHLEPTFPVFEPPPGLFMEQDLFSQVWMDEEGWGYELLRGSPAREWYENLPTIPMLFKSLLDVIGEETGLTNIRIESGPDTRAERHVWVSSADDIFGESIRIVAVLWYCPDEDLSFLALHTGPREMDLDAILAPMLAARCPGKGAVRDHPGP